MSFSRRIAAAARLPLRGMRGRAGSVLRGRLRAPNRPPQFSAESLDLADDSVRFDPLPAYEALRRDGPVHYLPKHDWWLVLGYDEVKAVFAEPELYSSAPYEAVDAVLIGADPPRHASVRRMVSRLFSSGRLSGIIAAARPVAEGLLSASFDLVRDYAAPFSRAVAAGVIGFDEATVADVVAASDRARDQPNALGALTAELDRLADRASVYRQLAQDGAAELCEAELRSIVRFLWLASITTTERVIADCGIALLRDPRLQEELRAQPGLIGPFVEERMRLAPPEHLLPRRMTAAAELGGRAMPAGALVQLCLTAANRDSKAFDAPAEMRFDRPRNRHLSFGSGVHHCIGAALARRTIPIAVEVLLGATPFLRALEPLDELPYFAMPNALTPTRCLVGA